MRLHYIQHAPFEGIANLQVWAENQGWQISGTHLYRLEKLPRPDDLDWLVIMGGPMNIYEEKEYPWLAAEKKFIGATIEKGKIVLGICLGAQLIADVLGGQVVRNRYKEIGWFPVSLKPEGLASAAFRDFPDEFPALHWHGDTFDLPAGSVHLAKSKLYENQSFSVDNFALALQFHPEVTASGLERWYVGHSCELRHAGITVPHLRADAQKYFPALKEAAERFWSLWLDSIF